MEKERTKRTSMRDGERLFDVTCVVGSVYYDSLSGRTPHLAAFELIAMHDAPGTYRFPLEDGGECCVQVEYDRSQSEATAI